MASTTSLFTGLSGLVANSRRLDVIGNNISNVNTTAFKSTRMAFSPSFSRSLSLGSSPSATTGGSNTSQIGLGVTVASTQRNFNNGPIGGTGVATDEDAAARREILHFGSVKRVELPHERRSLVVTSVTSLHP